MLVFAVSFLTLQEREQKKKALDDMSDEVKEGLKNMKFYKYYPIASEDTPDITSVKVWRFLRCFQCARAGWAPCSISCFLCLFLSLTANGALSPCRRRISIATMARHIKSSRIRGVQPFAGSVLNGHDYTRLDVVSSLSESESW